MSASTVSALSGQPLDHDMPVFAAPWEASAFAIAVKLSEAGHFTWPEWVEGFSAVIAEHAAHGDGEHEGGHAPDEGTEYYHQWFEALERMLARKGILDPAALDERHQYLKDNPVPHDHVARREPVCIA